MLCVLFRLKQASVQIYLNAVFKCSINVLSRLKQADVQIYLNAVLKCSKEILKFNVLLAIKLDVVELDYLPVTSHHLLLLPCFNLPVFLLKAPHHHPPCCGQIAGQVLGSLLEQLHILEVLGKLCSACRDQSLVFVPVLCPLRGRMEVHCGLRPQSFKFRFG